MDLKYIGIIIGLFVIISIACSMTSVGWDVKHQEPSSPSQPQITTTNVAASSTKTPDQDSETPNQAPKNNSDAATLLPTEIAECKQFYTATSLWNVPIDWSTAQIHPDSDAMIAAFFSSEKWVGTNTESYAPNIYFVTNETPLVSVRLRENSFRDAINDQEIIYGDPGGIVWMPLPKEARPAPGSDGQLAVINLDTGEEWGLNKGSINLTGQWHADGIYRYHIGNSGIPPQGFTMRGAGIGQVAGIIRPCEVDRGYIGHAVTIAYDYPCAPDVCVANDWPAVIPPFTKTDGHGGAPMDIPEGARMIIRPEILSEEILDACQGLKGCITWVTNMQVFGGFLVDNSGHPKTYGEGNATANWDPEIWTSTMLQDIPMEWYGVLDWNVDAVTLP